MFVACNVTKKWFGSILKTFSHSEPTKEYSQTLINYPFRNLVFGSAPMRYEIEIDIRQNCYITILILDHDVRIVFHPLNKKLATLLAPLDNVKECFVFFESYFFCCHNLGSTQLVQMLSRLGRDCVLGLLLLSQDTYPWIENQGQCFRQRHNNPHFLW